MEKRHQVFISSTYADLVDERAEVIQALLELDCIPAGMELFPATTEGAWDLIKGVIDDSDYYCLIVGGRYGSLDADGVSYTEKEYDYAVSKGKPLIAFIHGNPGGIVSSKTEKSEKGKDLLKAFVDKVEGAHHRKTWTSAEELGGLVSRGIVNLRKNHPAEGWVRGRFAASDAVLIELANLRARVAELSARAALAPGDLHPDEIAQMASGDQAYLPSISCVENGKTDREHVTAKTTWDTILKYVGPSLLNECTDAEFAERLKLCFYHAAEICFRQEA